jgi:hypothetical protein
MPLQILLIVSLAKDVQLIQFVEIGYMEKILRF